MAWLARMSAASNTVMVWPVDEARAAVRSASTTTGSSSVDSARAAPVTKIETRTEARPPAIRVCLCIGTFSRTNQSDGPGGGPAFRSCVPHICENEAQRARRNLGRLMVVNREIPLRSAHPGRTKDDSDRQVSWLVGLGLVMSPSQTAFEGRPVAVRHRGSPLTVAGAARASHPSSLFILIRGTYRTTELGVCASRVNLG